MKVDVRSLSFSFLKFSELLSTLPCFPLFAVVLVLCVVSFQKFSSVANRVHQELLNESFPTSGLTKSRLSLKVFLRCLWGVLGISQVILGFIRSIKCCQLFSFCLIVSNFEVFVCLLAPRVEHVSQYSGKVLSKIPRSFTCYLNCWKHLDLADFFSRIICS